MKLAEKRKQPSQQVEERSSFFASNSVFPNATIQRAVRSGDPCDVGDGLFFSSGNIPPGLNCDREELDNDASTSCCHDSALQEVSGYYRIAKEYTDRSIERLAGGMRVGDMLSSHFNSSSGNTKATVLENLRAIRVELDNEGSHTIRCRAIPCPNAGLMQIRQENPDAFCRWGTQAFHVVGTNYITMCVNMNGDMMSDWDTILHEVVHLQGIGDLPSFSDANQEQRDRGEFETYEFQRENGQYPNPTEYALRNADSYAEFVKATGAPDYTGDEGWPGWAKGLLGGAIAGAVAGGVGGALLGHYELLGDSIGLGGGLGLGALIGGAAIGGLGALIGWAADD